MGNINVFLSTSRKFGEVSYSVPNWLFLLSFITHYNLLWFCKSHELLSIAKLFQADDTDIRKKVINNMTTIMRWKNRNRKSSWAEYMQQETNTYTNPLLTPYSKFIYKMQYVIWGIHLLTRYNGCSHFFVGPGQCNGD